MPRITKNRDPWGERYVAQRVAFERERREWTYDGLAKRMADAGCEMHASALYKIEKGDPPRRITVTELLAFATVFEMPLAELVADPKTYLPQHVFEMIDRAARARLRGHRMTAEGHFLLTEAEELIEMARAKAGGDPEVQRHIEERMAAMSDSERAARVFGGRGADDKGRPVFFPHDELEAAMTDFRHGSAWDRYSDDEDQGEKQ